MRVCVISKEICCHSEYGDEEYSSWEEDYSSEVTNCFVVNDNYSYKCQPDENVEYFKIPDNSAEVHVVYMIYGTGDSFGYADGKIEVVHAFGSLQKANELVKIIEDNSDCDSMTIEFKDEFKKKVSYFNVAKGYLEHMSSVDIKTFSLLNKE